MNRFSWTDPPSQTAFPLARPGYAYIGAAAFATAVFALLGWEILSLIGLAAAFGICCFFRDPDRVIPTNAAAVVSPADGKIVEAWEIAGSSYYEGRCIKVSIFMTVFNVHVNRMPHEGVVEDIRYYPGKFVSANLDKASLDNERNAVFVKTAGGTRYTVVQIAGLIARRIICGLRIGDAPERGQRFGMICFGSRLDVYLPTDAQLKVRIGEKVQAGTSILGYLPES